MAVEYKNCKLSEVFVFRILNKMLSEKQKYDPWEVKQDITTFKVVIHCARYWMMTEWQSRNLSLPFWRLYHSRTGGGYVVFNDQTIEVGRHELLLIAPNTAFASYIRSGARAESIKGVRLRSESEIETYHRIGFIDQLFVHFSLGYPYDNIPSGLFKINLNEAEEDNIRLLERLLLETPNRIGFGESVRIQEILMMALKNIPQEQWVFPQIDARVLRAMKYIDKNLKAELTNTQLAGVANMATNSFARLFRENKQVSLKQYIQQCRIDKSVMLLLHTDDAIDVIAQECGYFDRCHFSKVFKSVTGMAPAQYRKKMNGLSAELV